MPREPNLDPSERLHRIRTLIGDLRGNEPRDLRRGRQRVEVNEGDLRARLLVPLRDLLALLIPVLQAVAHNAMAHPI